MDRYDDKYDYGSDDKVEYWKKRETSFAEVVNGPFKGQVVEGWDTPRDGIFQLKKNYWCENPHLTDKSLKVDCRECGACPHIEDVQDIPDGEGQEDNRKSVLYNLSIDGLRHILIEKGLKYDFNPPEPIVILLRGVYPFSIAFYNGKGVIEMLGLDGYQSLSLGGDFHIYVEGSLRTMSLVSIKKQILIGLIKYLYELSRSSINKNK